MKNKKRYSIKRVSNKNKNIIGSITKNSKGFAFLTPLKSTSITEDIFLNEKEARDLTSKDIVEVSVSRKGKRYTGKLLRIIERNLKFAVGEFSLGENGLACVEILGKAMNLSLPIKNRSTYRSISLGSAILVKIHHSLGNTSKAEIISVLASSLDETTDILYVMSKYNLKTDFPPPVLKEAKKIPSSLSSEECEKRIDLRELPFITIDGEDAKDFDDAVYAKKNPNGDFTLFVAIADVSHYVGVKTAMDKEALERTSSIYFPNFVTPMLPEKLSNGICSLNPKEERLAMVVEMDFDISGKRKKSNFYEAVIKSQARCTYSEIHKYLNRKIKVKFKRKIHNSIEALYSLFQIIRAYRKKHGKINLEFKEKELIINNHGETSGIRRIYRFESHQMIEEFMIAANEAVAKFLWRKALPSIYRVHEKPQLPAIHKFAEFARELGFSFKLNNRKKLQIQFQEFLEKIQNSPLKQIINFLLLRSMNQAIYSTKNIGHFALDSPSYSHFTSPIRRYSDLVLHRILKKEILSQKSKKYSTQKIQEIANRCSEVERNILSAEREINRIKEVRLAKKHLGQQFQGQIVGMNSQGFFVELKKILLEAFLPIEKVGDYFVYNEKKLVFFCRKTGRSIHLGQELRIQIANADPHLQRVELELIKIQKRTFFSKPIVEKKKNSKSLFRQSKKVKKKKKS